MRPESGQKTSDQHIVRTDPPKSADVHVHLNFGFFSAMEIISRLCCLVHLSILVWHKGKKTRHRRHLSLLRQESARHWLVINPRHSPANAFETWRPVAFCVLLPRKEGYTGTGDFSFDISISITHRSDA